MSSQIDLQGYVGKTVEGENWTGVVTKAVREEDDGFIGYLEINGHPRGDDYWCGVLPDGRVADALGVWDGHTTLNVLGDAGKSSGGTQQWVYQDLITTSTTADAQDFRVVSHLQQPEQKNSSLFQKGLNTFNERIKCRK